MDDFIIVLKKGMNKIDSGGTLPQTTWNIKQRKSFKKVFQSWIGGKIVNTWLLFFNERFCLAWAGRALVEGKNSTGLTKAMH